MILDYLEIQLNIGLKSTSAKVLVSCQDCSPNDTALGDAQLHEAPQLSGIQHCQSKVFESPAVEEGVELSWCDAKHFSIHENRKGP